MTTFISPLFSANCLLTGGQSLVARDLESLDRNMRFTFPHLVEVSPLTSEPLWHRSFGWANGSVGISVGQHTGIRITTAGIHALALYAPLGGMASVKQNGQTFSPQSRTTWMLFNEYPAQASTVATSGATIGLHRDRLQSTHDTMKGSQETRIAQHSQMLNMLSPAGLRAMQDFPLLLHCSSAVSSRWPSSVKIAEEMVYRFVAALLLDDSMLPRRVVRSVDERRMVDISRAYMFSALDQPITLTEVEALAGVGARALQTGFKRQVGMSPMQWLKEQRLLLAQQMLRHHPDMPVSEVALACGLNHFGRFAADFKSRFGVSPGSLNKFSLNLH